MRHTYRLMYRLGITPWDSSQVPAPVAGADGSARRPGIAVDLGCGTGAQALYLASQGWRVTAVDYLAQPIAAARAKDQQQQVDWRIADVTRYASVDPEGRLAATATLILDNGCLHGIAISGRHGWADTVSHLAAPGCTLLIRAINNRRHWPRPGPAGITDGELSKLLEDSWRPGGQPAPGWHQYLRDQR